MEISLVTSRIKKTLSESSSFIRSCIDILKQVPVLLLLVAISKIILMAITPMSSEFITFTRLATADDITHTLSSGPFAFWALILRAMYGIWLILPIGHPDIWSSIGMWYYDSSFSMNLLVLMLKTPLLLADIFTAPVIYKLLTHFKLSKEKAQWGMTLWLINPFTTLTAEMGGAPDVVATLLVTLSIYALIKKRVATCAIALLLSSLIRVYSILMAPIYLIILGREKGKKELKQFILLYIFALVFVIAMLGMLTSGTFIYEFLTGSPGYWYFLGPLILPIYPPLYVPIAITVVLSFLLVLAMWDGMWKTSLENMLDCIFAFLLALFAFSHWNPHFLLWIIPFVIMDYTLNNTGKPYMISFMAVALSWTLIYHGYYFTSVGNSVFFIPNLDETMTYISNSLYSLRGNYWISSLYLTIILKSVFTGICLAYIAKLARRNVAFFKRRKERTG